MLTLMLAFALELVATPEPAALGASQPSMSLPDGWQQSIDVIAEIDGIKAKHKLLMYLPKGYAADPAKKRPLVVALHGWKHRADMFMNQGDIAKHADEHGFVVAVPDMWTTIYETALYPETKPTKAWSKVPGARWVGEVILPYVREHYAVIADRAHTGVIGYSTGGRGAFLLAELYPEFSFAGSASGTFDLMRLKPSEGEYRIHAVVYGEREAFGARWVKDNVVAPALLPKLAGVRMYASHGAGDKSVRPDQIDALRDALKGVEGAKIETRIVKGAVHDWTFWNSQWPAMFAAMAATFAAR